MYYDLDLAVNWAFIEESHKKYIFLYYLIALNPIQTYRLVLKLVYIWIHMIWFDLKFWSLTLKLFIFGLVYEFQIVFLRVLNVKSNWNLKIFYICYLHVKVSLSESNLRVDLLSAKRIIISMYLSVDEDRKKSFWLTERWYL